MRLDPDSYDAIILDLDGVVTDTAAVHETAWRRLFDAVLRARSLRDNLPYEPFTVEDYLTYVDGKSRYDGARDFLASRGISLPWGSPHDSASHESVCGLANRKDAIFVELIASGGIRVFESTTRLVVALRRHGVEAAVVSASRNCRMILAASGLSGLFKVRVDGVDAERLDLPGKPDPAIFLEAAHRLDVSPERTILVEDAEAGVVAGRRGGFGLVIGIDRTGAMQRLRGLGADIVVADLAEVEIATPDASKAHR